MMENLKKIDRSSFLVKALITLFLIGIGAMYGGVGWCAAWVLEAGLGIAVNYSVFVWVGVGIFMIKVIPMAIFKIFVDRSLRELK